MSDLNIRYIDDIFPLRNYWPKRIRVISVLGVTLSVLTFFVYLKTLAPGVYGFDSAELATGVHTWGIVHPPGYPLYLLIGKVFSFIPIGDLAYRLNLMSAVFASLAVLINFLIVELIIGDCHIAWIGAGIFAVSIYFWQMAVVAEVYTLHVFFLALNLYMLLLHKETQKRKYLVLFSFFYGLSLTNHTSGILFAPGFAWLFLKDTKEFKRDMKFRLLFVGSFLLGLFPYIFLPLRAISNPTLNYVSTYYNLDLTTLSGFWWMISGQAYRFFAFGYSMSEITGEIHRFIGYLWRNFFGVGAILGILGLIIGIKKKQNIFVGLILLFLGNSLFFINYRVMDKDTMFLPALFIWSIFISLGISGIIFLINKLISGDMYHDYASRAVKVYFLLVIVIAAATNWQWVDLSEEIGPAIFAEQVLNSSKNNSVILAQWSPAVILEYYQVVIGVRPDLRIINRSRIGVAKYYVLWESGRSDDQIMRTIQQDEIRLIQEEMQKHPVYIVEYDSQLADEFEYLPAGNIFKLEQRQN